MKYNVTKLSFALLLLATLFHTTSACTCLPLTFEEAYESAKNVVFARVLSIEPYAPGCTTPDCLPEFPLFLTVKLKFLRKFKGCAPFTVKFFAKNPSQSAACGVFLQKGEVYMFNLPMVTQVRRLGEPSTFYQISSCQFHRLRSSLTKMQRKFLWTESMKPENQCMRPM